jgi:lipopolysaccharide/colanic/teichoic acid biosynthesis glycosyltransferase
MTWTSQPQTDEPGGTRTRKFRYLLLLYAFLTVLSFGLVWRYTGRIASFYGGDIENAGIQFGMLFSIFALIALVAHPLLGLLPVPLRDENRLRLSFLAGATIGLVLALYQSRYGIDKLVNYLSVSLLGSFSAVLFLTHRRFGLIEVIARPEPETIATVRAGHAGLQLADTGWDKAKRFIEFVLSILILIVAAPLGLILAMAVWLQDPGPLFVAKVAVKRAGRSFKQLKLRSMIKDAEGGTGPVPASPSDQRITRLGNLLRRTHIDELPQLINVLFGDMSLVGPRPERTVFVERHLNGIRDYPKRHAVRPGLAGLAQVYGDYYSTPREKLRYDLLYINNRSLRLDLSLFAAAVVLALFGISPRRCLKGRPRHSRLEQRWRRAYQALRGDDAPDAPGDTFSPEDPDDSHP